MLHNSVGVKSLTLFVLVQAVTVWGAMVDEHRLYYIYALIDPRTGHPRYVGLSLNPDQRYKYHYYGFSQHNSDWISELKSLDLAPWIQILCSASSHNAGIEAEKDCIYQLDSVYHLLNRHWGVEHMNYREAKAIAREEQSLTFDLFRQMRCSIRRSVAYEMKRNQP